MSDVVHRTSEPTPWSSAIHKPCRRFAFGKSTIRQFSRSNLSRFAETGFDHGPGWFGPNPLSSSWSGQLPDPRQSTRPWPKPSSAEGVRTGARCSNRHRPCRRPRNHGGLCRRHVWPYAQGRRLAGHRGRPPRRGGDPAGAGRRISGHSGDRRRRGRRRTRAGNRGNDSSWSTRSTARASSSSATASSPSISR